MDVVAEATRAILPTVMAVDTAVATVVMDTVTAAMEWAPTATAVDTATDMVAVTEDTAVATVDTATDMVAVTVAMVDTDFARLAAVATGAVGTVADADDGSGLSHSA